jgi:hypothetical protein
MKHTAMMSNTMQDNDEVADCDAEISMLVAMGFTVESASEALEASSGNIDHAIDYLVVGGEKSIKQGNEKKKTRIMKADSRGKTMSNKEKALPDTIAASPRHLKSDNKTDGPQVSLETIAPRIGIRSNKHDVHQFGDVQDAIEKPAGKCG